MIRSVGILGGTFDPVHYGHLHLAENSIRQLGLAELRFIPMYKLPHRPPPQGSAAQRLEMLNIATADHPHFRVDDCEISRGGMSYTIDTLRLLREELSGPLFLIIGMDNLKTLRYWYQWRSLLDHTHIIIANRPHYDATIEDQEIQQIVDSTLTDSVDELHQQTTGRIMRNNAAMPDISSSQIRKALACGANTRSLLPDKVLQFIKKNHLYHQ